MLSPCRFGWWVLGLFWSRAGLSSPGVVGYFRFHAVALGFFLRVPVSRALRTCLSITSAFDHFAVGFTFLVVPRGLFLEPKPRPVSVLNVSSCSLLFSDFCISAVYACCVLSVPHGGFCLLGVWSLRSLLYFAAPTASRFFSPVSLYMR